MNEKFNFNEKGKNTLKSCTNETLYNMYNICHTDSLTVFRSKTKRHLIISKNYEKS